MNRQLASPFIIGLHEVSGFLYVGAMIPEQMPSTNSKVALL